MATQSAACQSTAPHGTERRARREFQAIVALLCLGLGDIAYYVVFSLT